MTIEVSGAPPPAVDDALLRRIRGVLREFATPSDARGLLRIGANWLGIAAASLVWLLLPRVPGTAWKALVYAGAVLVIAGRMRGLESCTHEATHSSLFRTRSWNRRLQLLYAWPILDSVAGYQREHLVHHRRLGEADDPAYLLYEELGVLDFPRKFVWTMFVRPLLGYHSFWFVQDRISYLREDRRFALEMGAFWGPVLLVVGLTGTWRWFALFYLVPLLLVLPALLILSEVTDHVALYRDCPLGGTRNSLGWLQNLLLHAHDDGYHLVHHLNARVPVHRLRAAHQRLLEMPEFRRLAVHSQSYLQTLRQLRRRSSRAGHAPAAGSLVRGDDWLPPAPRPAAEAGP